MSRAAHMIVLVLAAATASGAACKGDEKKAEDNDLKFPPGWTPPLLDDGGLEAGGGKKAAADSDGWVVVDPGADKLVLVNQGIVKLAPAKDSRTEGTVWLAQTTEGLKVKVEIKGLTFMQQYALRVHLIGDCSAPDLASAGPPMNFSGSSLTDDVAPTTGLLGELKAAVEGDAKGTTTASAELQGHYSILGRSIVLHAPANAGGKGGDPLGARIACGVVGIFADVNAAAAPIETLPSEPSKSQDFLEPFDQRPSR